MGVNDDIADDALMRSVRNMRATNSVWKELLEILKSAERDLIAEIEKGAPRSFASRRASKMLREIREIIEGGAEEFQKTLELRGKAFAEIEEKAAFKSLEVHLPGKIELIRPAPHLLEAVAVSSPFDGAVLKDHLSKWTADTIFSMQAEMRTAIVVGEGIEPMQRRLRRVADIKIKDARTIARTYTAHVTSEARATLYRENSDVIAKEMWSATLDDRTCIRCASLDNETFPLGKGPRTPLHMNCRCVRVPVVRGRDELINRGVLPEGTRSSLDGQVPESLSFQDWLKKQPEERQKEVLGAKRFDLFQNGAPLDKFVNDENEIIPLSELRNL